MSRNPIIRNSTAEFLIFTSQAREGGIEVRYENGTIWLTQKQMAELFDTSTDNIGLHLKNIYADRELEEKATTEDSSVVQQEDSVIRNFRITAANGKKTARLTTQNEHFLPISTWIYIQKPDFIYIYISTRNRSTGKDVYVPPQDQRVIQELDCAWGID